MFPKRPIQQPGKTPPARYHRCCCRCRRRAGFLKQQTAATAKQSSRGGLGMLRPLLLITGMHALTCRCAIQRRSWWPTSPTSGGASRPRQQQRVRCRPLPPARLRRPGSLKPSRLQRGVTLFCARGSTHCQFGAWGREGYARETGRALLRRTPWQRCIKRRTIGLNPSAISIAINHSEKNTRLTQLQKVRGLPACPCLDTTTRRKTRK